MRVADAGQRAMLFWAIFLRVARNSLGARSPLAAICGCLSPVATLIPAKLNPAQPLSAGDKLGPYEILAPIGTGGMGEVWKARDTRLNRIVAIKQIKGEHSGRFEQEARTIAALSHPHICQIFDVGPDYLVLEFLEGTPLGGPMSAEQALPLAQQIASALEAAHKRGILHRDLKPSCVALLHSSPRPATDS
jgi:serine/threonine protein kinase